MSPDGTGGLKFYLYIISSNFPQVSYVVKFGNWMLLLMKIIPITLLGVLDFVKYMQGKFIEWDV